jgi:hypothetical protein
MVLSMTAGGKLKLGLEATYNGLYHSCNCVLTADTRILASQEIPD